MVHLKILHYISMGIIFVGALILFYFAFLWYGRENLLMGAGMFVMGLIAMSNFYLHLVKMKGMK